MDRLAIGRTRGRVDEEEVIRSTAGGCCEVVVVSSAGVLIGRPAGPRSHLPRGALKVLIMII